jgi:hypothetical protein
MKKLIVVLMPLLLCSCSGDDTKGTPVVAQTFHPPGWLQGQWLPQNAAQQNSFSFEKDDVCYYAANTNFTCWKGAVETTKQLEDDYLFEEHITDSTYAVNYTVNDVATAVQFKKLSADKINVIVSDGAEPKGAAGVFVRK